ncbi:PepSY domain-containing protein [Euhalothece natronophila Z-M001]|uniref:PepSY domain-containing protein n=1 Tax=Euhalothece natronophila Z-M001 TaxID=522448 RepID=A0A5B8NNT1_9CHRO|nr:PepSY domain-containing protein [Euhalothece natronophila]QDZ40607.1 PepSY domain-containing protein [Euhalothece natronophila Z-M001]
MNWRKKFREWHRRIAGIMILPLIITAITGISYRLLKDWFGWSRDQAHFLMVIHEGEYLGDQLKGIYVLLNGLGVLFLLTTGATMLFSSLAKSGLFSSAKQEESQ